jgi:hypothetical protein
MGYLGNGPNLVQYARDAFTGDASTTAFTLSYNPGGALGVLVFINGVEQSPTTNYSVVIQTLTFTSAPPSGAAISIIYLGIAGTSSPSVPVVQPQGRLTLTSNTPILNSNVASTGTIYYTPYIGAYCPIYTGVIFAPFLFSQTTLTLDSTGHVSGGVYDIFAYNNSGTLALGTGPAWSSTTSRGTGAGTTQISQTNGIWTNTNSIVLRNNSVNTSSIGAGLATYLGSFFATSTANTQMIFTNTTGTGGYLGLWNAYNRVKITAYESDPTTSWTWNSATFRIARGNSTNLIGWMDGLQHSWFTASYSNYIQPPAAGDTAIISVGINSVSAYNHQAVNAGGEPATVSSLNNSPPILGWNYVAALEYSGTGTSTYYGTAAHMLLRLDIEM